MNDEDSDDADDDDHGDDGDDDDGTRKPANMLITTLTFIFISIYLVVLG